MEGCNCVCACVLGRLMDHMKQRPEMTKWVDQLTSCQHCFRQFSTSAQLQYHVENAHGPTQSSSTPSHITRLTYSPVVNMHPVRYIYFLW